MNLKDMGAKPQQHKVNKILESRFGRSIDFDNLTFEKAIKLAKGITESLDRAKYTHGVHTAEKNPKYMEMYMVREGLHQWMLANRDRLMESETAKSEAILAARDMVDSIQDMLEKVGKMQNEQMPALLDTIRDQIGSDKAEGFKSSVTPLLNQLAQTLQQGRETADTAARALAGEATDQPMDMGGADMGMGSDEMPEMGGEDLDMGGEEMPEMGGEEAEFQASDAAVGGTESLGRERR